MQIRTYLSLFNGIGTGSQALKELGISPLKTYVSEIDKFANKTNEKNHPNSINLGDVTKWKEWDIDWSQVDVVTTANPCQSMSLSGKQEGFRDPRGQLLWDALEIIQKVLEHNPNAKWFIENVKMSAKLEGEFTGYVNEYLGDHYKELINSRLVTAQNRQRYYWSNFKLDQPDDLGITWGDVREHGVNAQEYYYTEKALQWLAKNSRLKNKTLDIWSDGDKAQMIEASHYKGYSNQRFFGICDLPTDRSAVGAMRGRYLLDGKRQDAKMLTAGKTQQYIEFRYDGKTNALTTVAKDNVVIPFTLPNRIPVEMFFFRYITPTEAERLQGFSDGYTEGVSKTQRLKQLGNGWTLPVIVHIFKTMIEEK